MWRLPISIPSWVYQPHRPRRRVSVAGPCPTVLGERLDRVDRIRLCHRRDDRAGGVDRSNARNASFNGSAANFDAVEYLLVSGPGRVDDAVNRSLEYDVEHIGMTAANALGHHLHGHPVALDQGSRALCGVELV